MDPRLEAIVVRMLDKYVNFVHIIKDNACILLLLVSETDNILCIFRSLGV